ncbi:MAG: metal/formaldehyde-sensitive transcriptional repressor [Novosphingobium sp.]
MAHIKSDSARIVARIHRIAGQVAAIERSVTGDAPCADTLNLVAAVRGAVAGLMDELVDSHIRAHVAAPDLTPEERTQGADELAVVLRRYVR